MAQPRSRKRDQGSEDMLDVVAGLPIGVFGLTANGTVIAQDITQALERARAESQKQSGLIVFVDPDLDGYLSEIVSALDKASGAEPAQFFNWALVVADDAVSEAEQFRERGKLRIFAQSRRGDALAWAAQ
ncbi:hypothetical protein WOA01_18470 [Methylocystis sp. IM2]|uniref:hypothetical protein n=1 Tax=Methylocystis sp. IM2 TaxID=3136563 RepID=UPI0030FA43D2